MIIIFFNSHLMLALNPTPISHFLFLLYRLRKKKSVYTFFFQLPSPPFKTALQLQAFTFITSLHHPTNYFPLSFEVRTGIILSLSFLFFFWLPSLHIIPVFHFYHFSSLKQRITSLCYLGIKTDFLPSSFIYLFSTIFFLLCRVLLKESNSSFSLFLFLIIKKQLTISLCHL